MRFASEFLRRSLGCTWVASLLCLFQIWWIPLFRKQVKETQKDRNTERQKHRKTTGRMCKAKLKSRSSRSRTQKGHIAPRSKVHQTNNTQTQKHKVQKQNICNVCCKGRNGQNNPHLLVFTSCQNGMASSSP